jgi:hypothetical protein
LTWPTGGAELRRYAIHTGAGGGDGLTDTTGQLSKIYGITGDTLILIRPDGYIGSIITTDWTTGFATATNAFARAD